MKFSKKNRRMIKEKNVTVRKNMRRRKKKLIIIAGGANFLDYFTPSYWFPNKPTDPTQVGKLKGEFIEKGKEGNIPVVEAEAEAEDIPVAEAKAVPAANTKNKGIPVAELVTNNKKKKKGKKGKDVREIYEIKFNELRTDKEFFDNPKITTWCFDNPLLEPAGIVHVTSIVGINVVRSTITTLTNLVGSKGTLDENMHRLRNEIYLEIENVMKRHDIDSVCNVGVAFTKDSGSLLLSAFGTALRKKTAE